MKQIRGRGFKGQLQRGFTLVELAIVLVIAGIILVAVLKGTDAINKAKVERMVADMKGLQGSLLEAQKRVNRMPGDCDNDGMIELSISQLAQLGLNNSVDKVERDPTKLGVCGTITNASGVDDTTAWTTTTPAGATVLANGTNGQNNIVYNELRRSGVVDGHRTNEELARHGFNDVYLVSSMSDALPAVQRANVIVAYGIPVWMAEAVDAEIDGAAQDYGSTGGTAGPACNGRVRRWDTLVTGATNVFSCVAGAGQYGTNRDALVSISFQFDTIKLPN